MRCRWLALLPLLLLGASQINVDESEVLVCVLELQDAAVTAGTTGLACNGAVPGSVDTAVTTRNFYVPANRRLSIDSYGVVLTGALAATEDCAFELTVDTTTAGAGSVISTLSTGPGLAETECTAGTITLNAVGESCTINNFTTTIPGGGWWSLRVVDADGGGANTCTNWQGGTVWVRGRFSSQ